MAIFVKKPEIIKYIFILFLSLFCRTLLFSQNSKVQEPQIMEEQKQNSDNQKSTEKKDVLNEVKINDAQEPAKTENKNLIDTEQADLEKNPESEKQNPMNQTETNPAEINNNNMKENNQLKPEGAAQSPVHIGVKTETDTGQPAIPEDKNTKKDTIINQKPFSSEKQNLPINDVSKIELFLIPGYQLSSANFVKGGMSLSMAGSVPINYFISILIGAQIASLKTNKSHEMHIENESVKYILSLSKLNSMAFMDFFTGPRARYNFSGKISVETGLYFSLGKLYGSDFSFGFRPGLSASLESWYLLYKNISAGLLISGTFFSVSEINVKEVTYQISQSESASFFSICLGVRVGLF